MTTFFLSAATTTSGMVLNSGDVLSIGDFAVASATLVKNGATIVAVPNGSAVDTTLGGVGLIVGTAISTHITGGGWLVTEDGGSASGTIVDSGGLLEDLSSDTNAVIGSGGLEIVKEGAQVTGTTIESGGFEVLSSVSADTGIVVQSGGTLVALPNSNAGNTATVEAGGRFIDSGVLIDSVQTPVISYASSVLEGATVGSDETIYVYAGARISNVTVDGATARWNRPSPKPSARSTGSTSRNASYPSSPPRPTACCSSVPIPRASATPAWHKSNCAAAGTRRPPPPNRQRCGPW